MRADRPAAARNDTHHCCARGSVTRLDDRPAVARARPTTAALPVTPSGDEPPTLSPLRQNGRDRFKRGLIVHRLLQRLPELPEAERDAAARRFLAAPTHRLPPDEQDDIRSETLAVLNHP